MGKFVLCKQNLLNGIVFLIVAGSLGSFIAGCGAKQNEENSSPYTPNIESTASPIQEPITTPVQTPIPKNTVEPTEQPTATPEVQISEEEMEAELKLLGMKNPDEAIDLRTVGFIYYTYLDDKGNEIPNISLIYNTKYVDGDKLAWNFYDNFTSELLFTCYSELNLDRMDVLVDAEIKTNIKKFKGLDYKVDIPFAIENFRMLEKEFGIKLFDGEWFWKVSSESKSNSDYTAPMIEYARGYIETVPKKYRTNSLTFIEIPSITPTSLYKQNPSTEYLIGNRSIEDELKYKGRKM